jgi:hypothetical protein
MLTYGRCIFSVVVGWGISQDILLITGSVLIFGSQVTPLQIFGASPFLSRPSFFMLYAPFILTLFAFGEPQICRLNLQRLKYDHYFNSTSLHRIYFA